MVQSGKAQSPATQETTSSAQPVATVRYGAISAAVFAEERELNGKAVTSHNVSLRRSYRSREGWESTHTLHAEDLLPAALALTEAYKAIKGTSDGE